MGRSASPPSCRRRPEPVRVALHLGPYRDGEPAATTLARVNLRMDAMQITRGRGFRQPSAKKRHAGWGKTRLERLGDALERASR